MTLDDFLIARGLMQKVIDELKPHIPNAGNEGVFCDAARIMESDKWFSWPRQTRFVVVGQCPNGDAVAIDTIKQPGAVFYVAHELIGFDQPIENAVICVANSPSDFIRNFLQDDDFPYDYWAAKDHSTMLPVVRSLGKSG